MKSPATLVFCNPNPGIRGLLVGLPSRWIIFNLRVWILAKQG